MGHRSDAVKRRRCCDAIPLVAVVSSFSNIWYCIAKGKRPIIPGAVGGFVGVAILTLCFFVSHGIGYFFYSGTADYFEDGALTGLVVFPPLRMLVWGSFGAFVGIVCGVGTTIVMRARKVGSKS